MSHKANNEAPCRQKMLFIIAWPQYYSCVWPFVYAFQCLTSKSDNNVSP